MAAIIETLFETPYGMVFIGLILTIIIIIEGFQKPKT